MSGRSHPAGPDGHAEWAGLVQRALADDADAWATLVERLERAVWKAVNMMTTDSDIREDAFSATWLRLAERLDTIREPHKLPGWVTTTATNEVRSLIRQRNRHGTPIASSAALADTGGVFDLIAGDTDPSGAIIAAERQRAVRDAFGRLDEPCREVLTVLVIADPPVPYDLAGVQLGRPIGSLGPTRRRCLEKLRELLTGRGDHDE